MIQRNLCFTIRYAMREYIGDAYGLRSVKLFVVGRWNGCHQVGYRHCWSYGFLYRYGYGR